ncbi:MAG: hypothetical protein GKR98_11785 [Boseongicola sp.]|nr:MAG: hypothetical protein GKR98_11785 [Boseongicola sp.]
MAISTDLTLRDVVVAVNAGDTGYKRNISMLCLMWTMGLDALVGIDSRNVSAVCGADVELVSSRRPASLPIGQITGLTTVN